jgi:hypothetical protein
MPDDILTSAPSSATESIWAALRCFRVVLTLSRVQPIVGTLAGIVSVIGAAFSVVQYARPADTGELVTIVQAADPRRSVSDAIIEVFTTQNALVATLTPDLTGHATKQLTEGVYVVRVRHPRDAADVQRVQVLAGQSIEIRATLRAPAAARSSSAASGSSSPIKRVVGGGVNAVRKAFRF